MIVDGTTMPMFPLGTVLLPGEVLPLHVFEPRYRMLVASVLPGSATFGIILIARGSEVGGGDERVALGTAANIVEVAEFPDGRYALLVHGEERVRVRSWLGEDPYPTAIVESVSTPPGDALAGFLEEATSAVRRARALLSELGATMGPWALDESLDPESTSWRLASLAPFGAFDRQRILEAPTVSARLATITVLADEIAEDATRLLAEGPTPE